jgi:hypothetical protein
MHSLTISFGPTGTMWQLMFKTEEAAQVAFDILSTDEKNQDLYNPATVRTRVRLIDDFGQKLILTLQEIHGYVLEDMDISAGAHIERALHQTRMQGKAQRLAEADASIRQAGRGPAILSPGINPNGQWPRQ